MKKHIFIDSEDGVGIDDCETFSRAFEERFDPIDPTENEYTLEVSSPGLDRKLKTEREFKHFIGREVDVKLFSDKDGKKEFTGILTDFENGAATVAEKKINIKGLFSWFKINERFI